MKICGCVWASWNYNAWRFSTGDVRHGFADGSTPLFHLVWGRGIGAFARGISVWFFLGLGGLGGSMACDFVFVDWAGVRSRLVAWVSAWCVCVCCNGCIYDSFIAWMDREDTDFPVGGCPFGRWIWIQNKLDL